MSIADNLSPDRQAEERHFAQRSFGTAVSEFVVGGYGSDVVRGIRWVRSSRAASVAAALDPSPQSAAAARRFGWLSLVPAVVAAAALMFRVLLSRRHQPIWFVGLTAPKESFAPVDLRRVVCAGGRGLRVEPAEDEKRSRSGRRPGPVGVDDGCSESLVVLALRRP